MQNHLGVGSRAAQQHESRIVEVERLCVRKQEVWLCDSYLFTEVRYLLYTHLVYGITTCSRYIHVYFRTIQIQKTKILK